MGQLAPAPTKFATVLRTAFGDLYTLHIFQYTYVFCLVICLKSCKRFCLFYTSVSATFLWMTCFDASMFLFNLAADISFNCAFPCLAFRFCPSFIRNHFCVSVTLI